MKFTFGENIRKLRIDKKMTQEDLANKLFVTRQTVSSWENNKSKPDYDLLVCISNLFEADLTTLLNSSYKPIYVWSKQKKKLFIILGVLSVLLGCAELFALPLLQDMQNNTYKPYYFFYYLSIHPITVVLLTVFIMMIITCKIDFYIKNNNTRKILFIISVMGISLFYASWLFVFHAPIKWLWVPFKLVIQFCYECTKNNVVFIIIGVILFLGINQKGRLEIKEGFTNITQNKTDNN